MPNTRATPDPAEAAPIFILGNGRSGTTLMRGMARKLQVSVEELPTLRVRFAERLRAMESSEDDLKAADAAVAQARAAYMADAEKLSAARRAAGERLAAAVMAELPPLKLDKARFRLVVG